MRVKDALIAPLLKDVDLTGVIKRSVQDTLPSQRQLTEAYVAEEKPFKQVSELISQKTKDAHQNLYKGYVEKLNRVSAELDSADRKSANPVHSEYRSLKQDESSLLNSVWLHELYFSNCFDPHSEIMMDTLAYMKLQSSFGTFDDYQRDFLACAESITNGWVITGYHLFLRRYVNVVVNGHDSNVPMGIYPVVVVDMWEHAMRDYADDKRSYIVAMMREFNWEVINQRFEKTEGLARVVK